MIPGMTDMMGDLLRYHVERWKFGRSQNRSLIERTGIRNAKILVVAAVTDLKFQKDLARCAPHSTDNDKWDAMTN